jgi:hypothetical protein
VNYVTKARFMYYVVCLCVILPTLLAFGSLFKPNGMGDGGQII